MAVIVERVRMDGRAYRVRVAYDSRVRKFALISGKNAGASVNYIKIRDLIGTTYSYQMRVEPDPQHPEDYDAFYEAISAPVASHTITMPYGQSTITFKAAITSGEDVDHGVIGGARRWAGLTVTFEPIAPQRRA